LSFARIVNVDFPSQQFVVPLPAFHSSWTASHSLLGVSPLFFFFINEIPPSWSGRTSLSRLICLYLFGQKSGLSTSALLRCALGRWASHGFPPKLHNGLRQFRFPSFGLLQKVFPHSTGHALFPVPLVSFASFRFHPPLSDARRRELPDTFPNQPLFMPHSHSDRTLLPQQSMGEMMAPPRALFFSFRSRILGGPHKSYSPAPRT